LIVNFIKYFNLLLTFVVAILFGRVNAKKNQQLKEINNSHDKLLNIIKIEKKIKNLNNVDSAKYMFDEIKNSK